MLYTSVKRTSAFLALFRNFFKLFLIKPELWKPRSTLFFKAQWTFKSHEKLTKKFMKAQKKFIQRSKNPFKFVTELHWYLTGTGHGRGKKCILIIIIPESTIIYIYVAQYAMINCNSLLWLWAGALCTSTQGSKERGTWANVDLKYIGDLLSKIHLSFLPNYKQQRTFPAIRNKQSRWNGKQCKWKPWSKKSQTLNYDTK